MVKNICQGSQPTHRQNSFFLSAPRMDFLFLFEKVKLASSKSVSFSVVEKPPCFLLFLDTPGKNTMIRRPTFDKGDDFYDCQQDFSQDFWESLNTSVLNAANEKTRIPLCWCLQGHHEQNKEVAMLKDVCSVTEWLTEGSDKAANSSRIRFKICWPFFTDAPLTREKHFLASPHPSCAWL